MILTRMRPLLMTVLTLALALSLQAAVTYFVGIHPMSFTMFMVVPVGAMALFFLATSGYYAGSVNVGLKVGRIDLGILMLVNLALLFLSYVVDYQMAASPKPVSITSFIAHEVTETKQSVYFRGMPADAPPVAPGDAGWLLLIIKLSAALAVAKVVHSSCPQARATPWANA